MKKISSILVCLFLVCSCCLNGQYVVNENPEKDNYKYAVNLQYQNEDGYLIASAFAVNKDYLITAKHVCVDVIRKSTIEEAVNNDFNIRLTKMGENKKEYIERFSIAALSDNYDLCLLKKENHSIPFLKLYASRQLQPGDKLHTIGAPMGVFPTLTEGRIIRFLKNKREYFSSINVFFGNSGGPVFYRKVFVGMVSRVFVKYHHISIIVSSEEIHKFLIDNKVDL
jgi:V8-like Glu-specific endopeptidase